MGPELPGSGTPPECRNPSIGTLITASFVQRLTHLHAAQSGYLFFRGFSFFILISSLFFFDIHLIPLHTRRAHLLRPLLLLERAVFRVTFDGAGRTCGQVPPDAFWTGLRGPGRRGGRVRRARTTRAIERGVALVNVECRNSRSSMFWLAALRLADRFNLTTRALLCISPSSPCKRIQCFFFNFKSLNIAFIIERRSVDLLTIVSYITPADSLQDK